MDLASNLENMQNWKHLNLVAPSAPVLKEQKVWGDLFICNLWNFAGFADHFPRFWHSAGLSEKEWVDDFLCPT